MRSYEQFEAEVFAATLKKKKTIKKRRQIISSLSAVFSIAIITGIILTPKIAKKFATEGTDAIEDGKYYTDQSSPIEDIPEADANDDGDTSYMEPIEEDVEKSEQLKDFEMGLSTGGLPDKEVESDENQNKSDAQSKPQDAGASAPPIDFYTADKETCARIYFLINQKSADKDLISCAYILRDGVHKINLYFVDSSAQVYYISDGKIETDGKEYEITEEDFSELLSIFEE